MEDFLFHLSDALSESALLRQERISKVSTGRQTGETGVFPFQNLQFRINDSLKTIDWAKSASFTKILLDYGFSKGVIEVPGDLGFAKVVEISADLGLDEFLSIRILFEFAGVYDSRKILEAPTYMQIKNYITIRFLEYLGGLLRRLPLLIGASGKLSASVKKYQQTLQYADALTVEREVFASKWLFYAKLFGFLLTEDLLEERTSFLWLAKIFQACTFEQTLIMIPLFYSGMILLKTYDRMFSVLFVISKKLPYLTHVKAKSTPLVALMHTNLVTLVQSLILQHPEAFVCSEVECTYLESYFRQSHSSLAFSPFPNASVEKKIFIAISNLSNMLHMSPFLSSSSAGSFISASSGNAASNASFGPHSDNGAPVVVPLIENFRKNCTAMETHLRLRCALHISPYHANWVDINWLLQDESLAVHYLRERSERILMCAFKSLGSLSLGATQYYRVSPLFSKSLSLLRIVEAQTLLLIAVTAMGVTQFSKRTCFTVLALRHALQHGLLACAGSSSGSSSGSSNFSKRQRRSRFYAGSNAGSASQTSSFVEGPGDKPSFLGNTPGAPSETPATLLDARISEISYFIFKSCERVLALSRILHGENCKDDNCLLYSGQKRLVCTHLVKGQLYQLIRVLAQEKIIDLQQFCRFSVDFGYFSAIQPTPIPIDNVDDSLRPFTFVLGSWSRSSIAKMVQDFMVTLAFETSSMLVDAESGSGQLSNLLALYTLTKKLNVTNEDLFPAYTGPDFGKKDFYSEVLPLLSWNERIGVAKLLVRFLCCRLSGKCQHDVTHEHFDFILSYLNAHLLYGAICEIITTVLKCSNNSALHGFCVIFMLQRWDNFAMFKVPYSGSDASMIRTDGDSFSLLIESLSLYYWDHSSASIYGETRAVANAQQQLFSVFHERFFSTELELLSPVVWFTGWLVDCFDGQRSVTSGMSLLSENNVFIMKPRAHVFDARTDGKQLCSRLKDALGLLSFKRDRGELADLVRKACHGHYEEADEDLAHRLYALCLKEKTGIYEIDAEWESGILQAFQECFFSSCPTKSLVDTIMMVLTYQTIALDVFVLSFVLLTAKNLCDRVLVANARERLALAPFVTRLVDILFAILFPVKVKTDGFLVLGVFPICQSLYLDQAFGLFFKESNVRVMPALFLHLRSLLICFHDNVKLRDYLKKCEDLFMPMICHSFSNFWDITVLCFDQLCLPLVQQFREKTELSALDLGPGVSRLVFQMTEQQFVKFLIDVISAHGGIVSRKVRSTVVPTDLLPGERHSMNSMNIGIVVVLLKSMLYTKEEFGLWLEAIWQSLVSYCCFHSGSGIVLLASSFCRLSCRVSSIGPYLLSKWGELITPQPEKDIDEALGIVSLAASSFASPSKKPLRILSLCTYLIFQQTPKESLDDAGVRGALENFQSCHEKFLAFYSEKDPEFCVCLALENVLGMPVRISGKLSELVAIYKAETGNEGVDVVSMRTWLFFGYTQRVNPHVFSIIQSIKDDTGGKPLSLFVDALVSHAHLTLALAHNFLTGKNERLRQRFMLSTFKFLLNSTLVYHPMCSIYVSSTGISEMFSLSALTVQPNPCYSTSSNDSSGTRSPDTSSSVNSPTIDSAPSAMDDPLLTPNPVQSPNYFRITSDTLYRQRHSLTNSSMQKASLKLVLSHLMGDWLVIGWRHCQSNDTDDSVAELLQGFLEELREKARILGPRFNVVEKPCIAFFLRCFCDTANKSNISKLSPAHAALFSYPVEDFLSISSASELKEYISQVSDAIVGYVPHFSAKDASECFSKEPIATSKVDSLKEELFNLLSPCTEDNHRVLYKEVRNFDYCDSVLNEAALDWFPTYKLMQPTCNFLELAFLSEARSQL